MCDTTPPPAIPDGRMIESRGELVVWSLVVHTTRRAPFLDVSVDGPLRESSLRALLDGCPSLRGAVAIDTDSRAALWWSARELGPGSWQVRLGRFDKDALRVAQRELEAAARAAGCAVLPMSWTPRQVHEWWHEFGLASALCRGLAERRGLWSAPAPSPAPAPAPAPEDPARASARRIPLPDASRPWREVLSPVWLTEPSICTEVLRRLGAALWSGVDLSTLEQYRAEFGSDPVATAWSGADDHAGLLALASPLRDVPNMAPLATAWRDPARPDLCEPRCLARRCAACRERTRALVPAVTLDDVLAAQRST